MIIFQQLTKTDTRPGISIVFSLLSLSCIVAPKRDLMNKISSYTSKFTNQYNNTLSIIANYNSLMNVNIELLRERTNFSSVVSSGEPSNYSSVSFISYIERIEIQNDNLSWANQVEESKQFAAFLYLSEYQGTS